MSKSKNDSLWNRVAIVLMVVLLAGFATILVCRMMDMGYLNATGRTIPVYYDAPDFSLKERGGSVLTQQDLVGKVWVADFIFTRCPGPCPIMNSKMLPLTEQLPEAKFVSISSDPEYDTPEVLASYADGLGAKPDQWFFLTGDKESINRVADGFKLPRINNPMDHSSYFILVDKKGRIRGYYDTNDPSKLKKLKQDAQALS